MSGGGSCNTPLTNGATRIQGWEAAAGCLIQSGLDSGGNSQMERLTSKAVCNNAFKLVGRLGDKETL